MTGCLLCTPASLPEEKHTHLVFHLNNDTELRFSDTRRFGRAWLLKKDEPDIYSGIEKLGKEPFDPDFSAEYLNFCFGKRKKAIKECLLEQSTIAGIGNIYSDEILFAAKLYPARPANSLTPEEYLHSKGQDYRNTPYLQVYGKEGNFCPICGHILCRIILGGRSSSFCPHCQQATRK